MISNFTGNDNKVILRPQISPSLTSEYSSSIFRIYTSINEYERKNILHACRL